MKNIIFNWRVNNQIHAPEVRVVSVSGKQIGILKISEALKKAQEAGLDLVEIAPKAKPPVVKIIELGKLRYQEEKRLRKEKKGVKGGETKEIRFSPFIAEADYITRLSKIKEFLAAKNKVRVVVKFGGRQMGSKDFGYKLTERILRDVGSNINVDMKAKFIGRYLTMIISPTVRFKKEELKKDENKTKN